MTTLYIIDSNMTGHTFDLQSNSTLIGRAVENDLQIKDPTVSRKHLKIIRKDEKYFIEDFESQNGTWINGQLIQSREAVEVREGDSIVIGDVLTSLGRSPADNSPTTQYSIDLSELTRNSSEDYLSKYTLTTNRKRLEKIHDASTVLMQSLDIDEVCEKIMDSLFYCLKEIQSGTVLLYNRETGELEERVSRARDSKKNIQVNYSRTIVDRVMREGKAVMIADTRDEDQHELSHSIVKMGLMSIICSPLISKFGVKGVIYLHSDSPLPRFQKDNLFLLAGLSAPAAVAIENALLFSEKAKIEKALKESASQWQATFDAIKDAVCILNSEGKILRCNEAMSEFLGKPPGEIIGQHCWELVHGTSEPIEDCPILLMRNTRRRETLVLPIGEKWFEVVADPILDKQGKITEAVHVISDITQRKLAEEKLKKAHNDLEKRVQARTIDLSNANIFLEREIHERKLAEEGLKKTLERLQETKDMLVQSEKLAAIGRLTAAIAHEILNPINIISLRIQVLKREDALSDLVRNTLNVCEGQVSRIIKIIRDLSRFSRAKKQEVSFITSIEIHEVIEHVLNMYAPELKEKKIKTDIHYDPDLPAIPLETDKMEQVLFNIISNSIDAMAGQETKILCIKTKPGTSKEHIQIDISDTGKGFSDEDLNKVFDPFYTTKDSGDGTGLGLFVSYGIIKELEGKIWAENNQWGGASLFIELPISTKNSSQ